MSEPRTEAGRRFLAQWFPEDDRDHDQYDITRRDIIAIEREAAGSAGADPTYQSATNESQNSRCASPAPKEDGSAGADAERHCLHCWDEGHAVGADFTAQVGGSAGAQGGPSLDVERLPTGARLILQKGDDYGNGSWYAVVENTIDLPGQDTGRLGSGDSPAAAFDVALARYARLAPADPVDRDE